MTVEMMVDFSLNTKVKFLEYDSMDNVLLEDCDLDKELLNILLNSSNFNHLMIGIKDSKETIDYPTIELENDLLTIDFLGGLYIFKYKLNKPKISFYF